MSGSPTPATGRSVLRQGAVRGQLAGAAAATCAVCCAAPVAALLGIGLTGAAATAFTVAFAGVVFALVVAGATVAAVLLRRRRAQRSACGRSGAAGPVPVELGRRPDAP